ncbi:MAG: transcriptional regulator, GntR family with aminotransferase domain [Tardiphaga sp.]|uniref:MocR-like pyridoxine biosynthesis transcription factor PdxR n=1 Tax=Tardiphaga sp. TaxID=1926292 RepID=UPI00261CEA28|nr:PLP-dependent aminotransferase family protein [Tardiphaga sp.]MDB5500234.1 transcriptional regulator, GntR family with aminotransferase domain [Tardiphaga sp.]
MANLSVPTLSAAAEARPIPSGISDALFWGSLFLDLDRRGPFLQLQIRQMIYAAIEEGRLSLGVRMPSSRELAALLQVSRNTVVIAYEQLVDQNFLVSRERSGYFVAGLPKHLGTAAAIRPAAIEGDAARWTDRYAVRPSTHRNIVKPLNWQDYPYPFIFGQFDPSLFPTNDWRESARAALSVPEINNWARDTIDEDDPALIEQLRLQVLPRRGVRARPDEIMMTIGAQHALYLIATLFTKSSTRIGLEDPGYPDARNIFGMLTQSIVPLQVDGDGLVPDAEFESCDLAYVTAGHQCPTTVAMPHARRLELLKKAQEHDILLIEDDYESELISEGAELSPLMSLDRNERVLYVGSFSKVLAPGLRLGYVVAPAPVIRELRALRRLMLRHPPLNNQRVAALFIGLGHYRSHLQRVSRVLLERAHAIDRLLPEYLAGCTWLRGAGSTSYWVTCPPSVNAAELAEAARNEGVVIEPGDIFSMVEGANRRCFRLGFSSIRTDRIEPGLARLGRLISKMS